MTEPMVYQVKRAYASISLLTTRNAERAIKSCEQMSCAGYVEMFYELMPAVPGKTIFKNAIMVNGNFMTTHASHSVHEDYCYTCQEWM